MNIESRRVWKTTELKDSLQEYHEWMQVLWQPCPTVLRLIRRTDEYELSDRCMRCIMDHRKCEWPAGAIFKNAGMFLLFPWRLVDFDAFTKHRMHVSTTHVSNTEDQSVAAKLLGLTLTQSSASIPHVVINSPYENTVKATSSIRPAPSPSSATATKQAKHPPATYTKALFTLGFAYFN
ncbi:hypothetical protein BDR03DRAFT_1091373 [Suillus americanus]|nr:hypothetical protein BDR03DRAFT_1091373 [Suillus americanus]